MNKITDFSGPYYDNLEIEYVTEALKNVEGSKKYYFVEKFEKDFAQYIGRKYCLLLPSCTSALYISQQSQNIKQGDEVIVPDFTWAASVFPTSVLGAKPVFVDIDIQTWCISPEEVEKNITDKTRAVIVVDIYGNMSNWSKLEDIAKKYNLFLIQDGAEALGSKLNGRQCGIFGDVSVFSLHRTKTLATLEGGVLLTDNKEVYDKCYMLRDLGRGPLTKPYFNDLVSLKFMPTNIQGALACAQLEKIELLLHIKREQFEYYKEQLSSIDNIYFNYEDKQTYNSAWVTTVLFDEAHKINIEKLISYLNDMNVPARRFFYPVSSLPSFGLSEQYKDKNKVAYDISNRGINLPCSFSLTRGQQKYICDCIKSYLTHIKH